MSVCMNGSANRENIHSYICRNIKTIRIVLSHSLNSRKTPLKLPKLLTIYGGYFEPLNKNNKIVLFLFILLKKNNFNLFVCLFLCPHISYSLSFICMYIPAYNNLLMSTTTVAAIQNVYVCIRMYVSSNYLCDRIFILCVHTFAFMHVNKFLLFNCVMKFR